jgi:NADP-reducing hydrogenase subunit HndB
MAALTAKDFDEIKASVQAGSTNWIKVGMSTCGIAAGAGKIYRALADELEKQGQSISLRSCGCLGMCYAEPLVEVCIEGLPRVVYCRVTEDSAREIVRGHVMGRKLLQDYILAMHYEEAFS